MGDAVLMKESESLERLLEDASSHARRISDNHVECPRLELGQLLDHDVQVRARRLEHEALVHAVRTVVLKLI